MLLFGIFLCHDRKKRDYRKMVAGEEQFEHYLSEITVAYGKTQNIEEASFEVEEKEIITLQESHPYVKEYRAMCGIIEEDGDEQRNGSSVFQKNVQYLKEEIRQNLLLCKAKLHAFSGLDILALLPFFFLIPVESWAVSVSDGLQEYYRGSYGFLSTVALFLVTYLVYRIILWLLLPLGEPQKKYAVERFLLRYSWIEKMTDRYISRNYTRCLKKNEQLKQLQGFGNIREFLVKKVCFFIVGCFLSIAFFLSCHQAERTQILSQNGIPQYRLMGLQEEQRKEVELLYKKLAENAMQEDHTERFSALGGPMWTELEEKLGIRENEAAMQEIRGMMKQQAAQYGAIRWRWYELLLVLMAACLAALLPELKLFAREWKSREKRMSEGLRLQTVALLVVRYERITVEDILMHMENFAEIFQSQIAEAVDHFSYHRSRTLQKLKQDIPDEPVQRICDALEFCEELPVREAFLNLEEEREYFLKKNLEEQRNYQSESVALARMIAYLPLFLLIVLKMIVPFVAEGLTELSGYSQSMQGFF